MSRNSGVYATLWQEGIHRSKWIAIDTNRSISENIRFCTSYLRLGKEPSLMRIHIIQLQFLPYYNKRSKLLFPMQIQPKKWRYWGYKALYGVIYHSASIAIGTERIKITFKIWKILMRC
jgi:hypothetical protein